MMPQKGTSAGPFLALACISMVWGYNWVIMKESLQYAGPMEFNALRMILGSAVLLLFMLWKKESLRPELPGWTAALGILQTGLGTGLIVLALETGGAGKTSILVYTLPFWILLLAWLVLDERIRGVLWVPILLAFCGLVFILEPWNLQGTLKSKVLAVLAGFCWAAGVVLLKLMGRGREINLIRTTAWQMIFGSLPLAGIALIFPSGPVEWSPFFIGSILYNSILVCALAFVLWTYVIDRLPAGIAGLGTLAVPVIGMTTSRIHLHEDIGFWEGWGIVLIVTALTFLSLIRLREQRKVAIVPGPD